MPKKKSKSFVVKATGLKPVNRKARRAMWAAKPRPKRTRWAHDMLFVPDIFPLKKAGKSPDGKTLYKRLG